MQEQESQGRYAKQERFAGVGPAGQAKLGRSRVLICGCGATGGTLADLLARAGVGFLRVVDRDFVERSNLQRQTLFKESDADDRLPKAIAAVARLREINREIEIEPQIADITPSNILELARDVDLIMDGTDNFETRYLLNDAALELGIPWIYTGVLGGNGQSLAVIPGEPGCLRCVMDTPPPAGTTETCDTAGVIGPAVAVVAGFSAGVALKMLTQESLPAPTWNVIDVWEATFRSIGLSRLRANGGCPACRDGERRWLHGNAGSRSAVLCGRNAVQITPEHGMAFPLDELASRLESSGPTTRTPFFVRHQVSEPECELTIFQDGRAIVQGTEDLGVARGVYARVVGG